ncbi:unnamed protein product [Phytomonas sp. Hart1]|nr:unnamed protein product [Phytomonas sp. Hart1]|eukprot:CCW70932.1 unnamed protein product [Phytomonas sp. isolate Hart1]
MSDGIRELAEERRRRFQQLRDTERPHSTPCPDCAQPTYLTELCPQTGRFHGLEHQTLVGGDFVRGKIISSSALMGAIERTRVKWVPSRTQLVKADAASLNIFQSFAAQVGWNLQRYGILYGLYDPIGAVIEVHAVYEPEQHGNRFTFEMIPDPRLPRVDQIASGLGLRRVGAICTHPPRDPEKIVMSARELLLSAREQSLYGDECVLLTIAPNLTDGMVECQAWQTSPQCVHLFRVGFLDEPSTPSSFSFSEGGSAPSSRLSSSTTGQPPASAGSTERQNPPSHSNPNNGNTGNNSVNNEGVIASKVPLEVAQEDTDGRGHRRCVTKEPCTRVDTRWFTSYIAVQQFTSEVVRGAFMRISRPGMPPPTFQNLKNYMNDPKRRNDSFAEKIADFHVLIFLSTVFSENDDLPELVRIAKAKQMSEEARNYEIILGEYMN